MKTLDELFKNNREWAEKILRQDPDSSKALAPAVAHLPVDRLRRQPRARQPDRRPAAGRHLRAPEHRQHGGAHRPQLPVGHAVRGGHPQGEARHRRRPLRLQRRAGRAAPRARRARRQLAAPRAGRAREAHAHASRPAAAKPRPSTVCASSTSSSRCRTSARPPSRATPGSAARSCTCTAGSTASPTGWRAISARPSRTFAAAQPTYQAALAKLAEPESLTT